MGLIYGIKSGTVQMMNYSDYSVSPDTLKNEAHVWFCCPDEITDPGQIAHYQSLLSKEEKKHHKRFLSEIDQHSYLVSHALIRSVLSKYTDLGPAEWQFKKNTHGRPEIKQSTGGTRLGSSLRQPGLGVSATDRDAWRVSSCVLARRGGFHVFDARRRVRRNAASAEEMTRARIPICGADS